MAIGTTMRTGLFMSDVWDKNSTLLPDKGGDFWTPELFVAELNNLIDELGIGSRYHVLGQSWGGMLAAEFGVTRPKGLKSLTIANSPASMELWVKEANRLRGELPRLLAPAGRVERPDPDSSRAS